MTSISEQFYLKAKFNGNKPRMTAFFAATKCTLYVQGSLTMSKLYTLKVNIFRTSVQCQCHIASMTMVNIALFYVRIM